jgi:DNA polymerase-3 subunit beta
MTLVCESGKFVISGQDPEDFPQLPQVEPGKTVSLPAAILEKGVRRAAYAVSSDETRQMLTGVLVQILDGEIRMVATDGHRLAKAAFRGPHKSLGAKDLIIPPKALNAVVRLSAGQETVALAVSKNFAIFELGPTTLFSRLIDGNFPNYEQVVPKESPRRVTVRRDGLIAALRRMVVLSDTQTRQIKLAVKPERIELSVSTADVGEGQETIPVDYSGEPLAIGYNAAYLLDALRTMDSDQVVIRLNTPTSPGVLAPVTQAEDEDLLCLVMPLRLPEA